MDLGAKATAAMAQHLELFPRMDAEHELFINFETRSAIDLARAGPWKYARDSSTNLSCVSYAIGAGQVSHWRPDEPVPAGIAAHIDTGLPIVAYGASFERAIWHCILAPRYGWPEPRLEHWLCSAAMAAMLALPGSIGEAARILGLVEPGGDNVVELERAFANALRPLLAVTRCERGVWLLDQRMNERGITVDLELVQHAQSIVEETKGKLDLEMREITAGKVAEITQLEKLRAWCRETQDLELGALNHGEIGRVLARHLDLDPRVRRVLEIRLEGAKSSTWRLPVILDRTGADRRMRDNFVYHGASTGRWTAQGAGLQNLPAHCSFEPIPVAVELIKAGWTAESLSYLSPPLEDRQRVPAGNAYGCARS